MTQKATFPHSAPSALYRFLWSTRAGIIEMMRLRPSCQRGCGSADTHKHVYTAVLHTQWHVSAEALGKMK